MIKPREYRKVCKNCHKNVLLPKEEYVITAKILSCESCEEKKDLKSPTNISIKGKK